jgi:hypothetical protein
LVSVVTSPYSETKHNTHISNCHGFYRVAESEWANSTRSDLILAPDVIDNEQRPLSVEFQKTVGNKFIKRAMNYCLQASSRYDIDLVMLIVCIDTIAESPKEKLEKSKRLPCCATIPCDFWAAECLILSKETIKEYISVKGSLHPLVALGVFLLIKQAQSPYYQEVRIQLIFLYEIAKNYFQEMHNRDLSLLEELKNVYDTQLQGYKNIMYILQTEEQPLDTITQQIQALLNEDKMGVLEVMKRQLHLRLCRNKKEYEAVTFGILAQGKVIEETVLYALLSIFVLQRYNGHITENANGS